MIVSLLIDPAVHDGQGDRFSSTHTHTPPPQRAADLPPRSSSGALLKRVVSGTLKIHYDDHGGLALLMVFPIRPFGHYFAAPFFPL